ncbi:MAG: UTP--glucose-1-phosphate uridylyltransferase [Candidatus Oleimicrobiaceae bacterium]
MAPTHFQELRQRFEQAGQGHVFRFWDKLSSNEREQLLTQAASIDLDLMAELWRRYILTPQARYFSGRLARPDIIPLPTTPKQRARARVARARGEEALRTGQVGVVLVAGGQGSRLGWPHPKGTLPIGPVTGKSLFQLHAEKLLAISLRVKKPIPWYIMTSETTHEETVAFFHDHAFFGLPASQVHFFAQRMIPALDAQGKFFLAAPHRIFTNPDGHGGLLRALATNGMLRDMAERGLKWLFYFQVDNVLVKICDPIFLGYHLLEGAEVSAKVLRRRHGLEKMGIAGKVNGRAAVVEYSDLPPEKLKSVTPRGDLRYWAGSIGIHVFNVAFLRRLHESGFSLPYHVAHKKIPHLDAEGRTIEPARENGYKFEQFIFDVLPQAEKVVFMEVAREEEFSPIKNDNGVDSPETARRDLMCQWAQWLERAGYRVPRKANGEPAHAIEISPLRALDAEELAASLPASFDIAKDVYVNA